MAIKETIQIGDPRLRAKNLKIKNFDTTDLSQLVKDLRDTMRENRLIGMAAPQLGVNLQVFITEPRATKYRTADQSDELRAYINPTIVGFSDEKSILYEGCGSVLSAQLFGPVERAKEIIIEAYDVTGKKFRYKVDGILGRVILHEFDHILGILFTDIITDYTKLAAVDYYRANLAATPEQIKNSTINVKELEYL